MHSALAELPDSEIYTFGQMEEMLLQAQDRAASYSSQQFKDLFSAQLKALFKERTIDVMSVDIFDTLLLRGDESEISRFLSIAEKQADMLNDSHDLALSKHDLLAARLSGTKISYKASKLFQGCREGSIRDIYRVAARALDLPSTVIDSLIDIEIEHEKTVLQLNTGLVDVLADLKQEGCRLLLISDMYLHQPHLQELLCHFLGDDSVLFERVISSADTTVSKGSGKLFNLVQEEYEFDYRGWAHIGDASKGDYVQPAKLGISSLHLPIASRSLLDRQQCEKNTRDQLREYGLDFTQFGA